MGAIDQLEEIVAKAELAAEINKSQSDAAIRIACHANVIAICLDLEKRGEADATTEAARKCYMAELESAAAQLRSRESIREEYLEGTK